MALTISGSCCETKGTDRLAQTRGDQNEDEKCSHGMDWRQNGLWYDPKYLDVRMSENVSNISYIHKLQKSHEKCKVEFTAGGKTLTEVKIQWSIFQTLFVIAMIHSVNDEENSEKFTNSKEKINYRHGRDKAICKNWKRTRVKKQENTARILELDLALKNVSSL